MRYFLDNVLTLQPQNLTLDAIWAGWFLYALVILACLQDILLSKFSWIKRVFWILAIFIPFLGSLLYAAFCLITADSSFKELLRSRQQSGES